MSQTIPDPLPPSGGPDTMSSADDAQVDVPEAPDDPADEPVLDGPVNSA